MKEGENLDIPFNRKVHPRLLKKLYRDKVFYYVREDGKGKFISSPCVLSDCEWSIDFPFIKFLENKMPFDRGFNSGANWEDMFETFEESKTEAKRRNYLYFDCFRHKPFLELKIIEQYQKQLMYIESQINKILAGYEDFEGIDFCDVSAGGIQIRGHHKQIKGYTYGQQPTIKYDFSNMEEVIDEFICMWRRIDKPQTVAKQLDFIRHGEKYGWD